MVPLVWTFLGLKHPLHSRILTSNKNRYYILLHFLTLTALTGKHSNLSHMVLGVICDGYSQSQPSCNAKWNEGYGS